MNLALVMTLQAAAPAAAPVDFDLRSHRPGPDTNDPRACGVGNGSEIVVCGRRAGDTKYRLEELGQRFSDTPLVAEVGIAKNASVRAYGESVEMPMGQVSKRAMIGVKLKF